MAKRNINPETEAQRRADISKRLKALWQDPAYVAKIKAGRKRAWQRPEYQAKMEAARKAQWAKPGHVEMMSEKMKQRWQDQPERMKAGLEKAMDAKREDPAGCSRTGVPTGWKKAEAQEAWQKAEQLADTAIRGFTKMGVVTEEPLAPKGSPEIPETDDEIAKMALREACVIAFSPLNDKQTKLKAFGLILTFTKAKPAKRIEGATNVSAEDWLTEALRIGMAAASDNVSCH
jgi:hypothetical protein